MPLCLEHFAEGSGRGADSHAFPLQQLTGRSSSCPHIPFPRTWMACRGLHSKGCNSETREVYFALEFKRYGSRIVTRLAGGFSLARLATDRLQLQLIDDELPSYCGRNALSPPCEQEPALSTATP